METTRGNPRRKGKSHTGETKLFSGGTKVTHTHGHGNQKAGQPCELVSAQRLGTDGGPGKIVKKKGTSRSMPAPPPPELCRVTNNDVVQNVWFHFFSLLKDDERNIGKKKKRVRDGLFRECETNGSIYSIIPCQRCFNQSLSWQMNGESKQVGHTKTQRTNPTRSLSRFFFLTIIKEGREPSCPAPLKKMNGKALILSRALFFSSTFEK